MSEHLSSEAVDRFLRGDVAPGEARAVLAHLRTCARCAASSRREHSGGAAARMQASLATGPLDDSHAEFDTLLGYIRGELEDADALAIAAHLEACASCADDAETIRAEERKFAAAAPLPLRGPRRRTWLPALAAAAALAAAIGLAWRAQIGSDSAAPPPPARRVAVARAPVRPAEWTALVDAARSSGRLPSADLRDLQSSRGELRGEPTAAAAAERFVPAATVIDETRPRFFWPAVDGAASYQLLIADDHDRIITGSPTSQTAADAPRELQRGQTYQWQVRVVGGGVERYAPEPPERAPRFRVATAREHDELAAARRQFPADHLLAAAIAARAGMHAEASRELDALGADPAAAALAASLRASLPKP